MFIKSVCTIEYIEFFPLYFLEILFKTSLVLITKKSLFNFYFLFFLVFSFESLITATIAKWSEIEVLVIPFLRDVSKTQFVKMLSISVALEVVTLVGLLITGMAPFSNMLLKNCLISELW